MIATRNQCDSSEGERRKLEAHVLLAARRELFILRGRRALLRRLLDVGKATADDVRAVVELPFGIDPKCFGAVPGALVLLGLIGRVGFAVTARPQAHARPVSVWRLLDRAGAIAWLEMNQDRPVPDKVSEIVFFGDADIPAWELEPLDVPPEIAPLMHNLNNTAADAGTSAG